LLAAVLACLVLATPASAEWFADLYLGRSFTQSHDVQKTDTSGLTVTFQDVGFDSSVAGGGRFGYWFTTVPFLPRVGLNVGLGLDVFHVQPDISSQAVIATTPSGIVPVALADTNLSVTTIGFDVMLRWPVLPSQQFPKGRLQPYVRIGPAIFMAKASDTTNFGPPNNQSNTDTSVGVKVAGGVAWQFHQNLAVFGEYRFTHFSPEFTFNTLRLRTPVDTDINTHYLLSGISFRF
jgi:opacity protein-like surface antigen